MDAIIQPNTSKLNENNFHLWKLRTQATLKAKEAWIAITENDPGLDPVNAKAKAAWDKANNIAMGYMTNTIEDSVLGQFINVSTPRALWDGLRGRFEANTEIRKIELRQEIAALKMRTDETWNSYLNRATVLGEKAKALGMDVTDNEISYNVVRGLPSKFQALKVSFSAQAQIDMDLLKRALNNIEEGSNSQRLENELAYKAKAMPFANKRSNFKSNVRCWNCNKTGHKKSECWYLLGKQGNKNPQSKNIKSGEQKAQLVQGPGKDSEELWSVELSKQDGWILDSGATSHMCTNQSWLRDYTPEIKKVRLANEATASVIGKGTVHLLSHQTGSQITVQNVLCVPSLRGNLISVSKIVQNNKKSVIFNNQGAKVLSEDGTTVATAKLEDNFYHLNVDTVIEESHQADLEKPTALTKKMLWHKRLNHLNEKSMNQLKANAMVEGLKYGTEKLETCHSCSVGKFVKLPYKQIGKYQSANVLELLHVDLCGPFPCESIEGERYMMTVVDDYSRYIFSVFVKNKFEVKQVLENLIRQEETRTERMVKLVRSDNGGEFLGSELQDFFNQKGIKHQLTQPYSPQSNGIAERVNRTLIEAIRTMLIDSKLPHEFWAEAAKTATYIRNACPTKINQNQTPREKYCGKKPSANHFRIFGCLAYCHIPKEKRNSKLEPTGKAGIFTGYARNRSAFRIFDPETRRFCETKHVKFHEEELGAKLLKGQSDNAELDNMTYELIQFSSGETKANREEHEINRQDRLVFDQPVRRSERIRDLQTRKGKPFYNEEEESTSDSDSFSDAMEIRAGQNETELSSANDGELTPKTVKEALEGKHKEEWLKAMEDEIMSLKSHDVWELVPRQKDIKTIPSKWVFRIKRNSDGSIERFKARLVGMGCNQTPGQDCEKTFSPVVRLDSLRTLLAVAKMKNYKLKVFDVSTAYLYGKLNEDIAMEQPEGFTEGDPNKLVCKLKRGIYGLKQSGRLWYTTLRDHLLKMGFSQLIHDPCIFQLKTEKGVMYLAIYVDDLIAVGSNDDIIDQAINRIQNKFELNEVTETRRLLGWDYEWANTHVKITQETYAKEMLKRFGMDSCKSVKTPLEPGTDLSHYENSPRVDSKQYQEIVGSLMYLMTSTRPDISYAISTVSRYLNDPREIHMQAVKRILRYVKGTVSKGLFYTQESGQLTAFADASWNDGGGNEKSVTGYVIQIGTNTIQWKSKKQNNVSLSTAQSEITAVAECLKELMTIRGLIAELGGRMFLPLPVIVYNDNQAAISSTGEISAHTKIRHFVRSAVFISEQVRLGNYRVEYLPGDKLCADALTKVVSATKLNMCCNTLNLK